MLLQAPINSLGYGVAGYNVAKQLAKKIDDLTIFPIGQPEPELYQELAQYDWRNQEEEFSWDDSCLKIWHQNGLHEMVGRELRVGFPIFELNQFTKEEKLSIRSCNQIYVCSKWAKDIVENETGHKFVSIVPLGVDRSIFHENNSVKRPATIFFNCGKWEIRKGHDIIKECFEKAFTQNDNVELWMMCENPFLGEKNNDWINYYKSSSLANKIRFIPRQKSHRDVYNIMRQVDVGVFPVRAEGWNLELLELLSCGKHVITTDYSGHTEFTNRSNSRIINTGKLEPAQDGIWFHGQGNWAKLGDPQKDQLITHMRELHQQKKDSELDINLAGIETAIKFSWENTAEEILNGL
jgi:glycosyltransferase involved in cell wall biosynthesis